MVTCIKHFPGDGTEERDQHLVLGVNELSPEEWDASFGRVYKHHIDDGVEMFMAGHIALPYYQKKLNPRLADKDILPATLAEELIIGLLKEQLGFNGMVITDASHMLGMTSAMRREDYVPGAIAAGCDMFLFFNDTAEDFGFMLAGYQKGVITEERMNDAVRRVLGLKAKLNLHVKQAEGTLLKTEKDLEVVGCAEHLAMAADAADKGITLVKNTLDQLPIRPETHKRIRIYHLTGEQGGIHAAGKGLEYFCEELDEARVRGDGERRDDPHQGPDVEVSRGGRCGADRCGGRRLRCAEQLPYPVEDRHEQRVPLVRLGSADRHGLAQLHDPPARCDDGEVLHQRVRRDTRVISQVVDKIMGESEFKGKPNDLVWADKWQAKL